MTTAIYHSADYDGLFCREIARKFMPDAQLIGWNFGEPKVPVPTEGTIYILDLSPECLVGEGTGFDISRLVWIDHHKTAIDKYDHKVPGYRIDGVAACRLAWQWFFHAEVPGGVKPHLLSAKDRFIDRLVPEPLAVRLAGEYDIWDKRDPMAETFQYGLRAQETVPWTLLLEESERGREITHQVIADGQAAQRYAQNTDADICRQRTWLMDWEGLRFLCVNTARFNSLFFAARDLPETGHDALLGFCWTGQTWMVSLYHAKHRTDLDLSQIAIKHGGGGHRGACGFTCPTLPFSLSLL